MDTNTVSAFREELKSGGVVPDEIIAGDRCAKNGTNLL